MIHKYPGIQSWLYLNYPSTQVPRYTNLAVHNSNCTLITPVHNSGCTLISPVHKHPSTQSWLYTILTVPFYVLNFFGLGNCLTWNSFFFFIDLFIYLIFYKRLAVGHVTYVLEFLTKIGIFMQKLSDTLGKSFKIGDLSKNFHYFFSLPSF